MRDLILFRDRRFVLLFAARTASVLGGSFGPVALVFGVLGLPGATAATLTIVLGAQSIPQLALLLWGGVIGDRVPRHRLMASADVISALAFAGLATMLITGRAPLGALAACAAVVGIASALLMPALTGIVPDVVAPERLQTANGLLRLGTNSARVLGLALAGGAVVLVGAGWALAINAGTFAVSAALLMLLRTSPLVRTTATSLFQDLRDGWRAFSSRQWLWVIVLQFSIVVAALQASFGVLGPVVAKAELGGAPAWSAILAADALGMFLGVFVSIRIRPSRPLLVATLTVFLLALPILLLGVGAPLLAVMAGAFLLGIGFDVFGVLWETTLQREVPIDMLSRVSAYDALGSFVLGPVGLVVAAPLAALIGPRPAMLWCAGIIIATTAATLLSPQVRRIRAPKEPAPASTVDPEPIGQRQDTP